MLLATLLLGLAPLLGGEPAPNPDAARLAPPPLVSDSGGSSRARPPELYLVFPAEGEALDPVILLGSNFGPAPIPWFGILPSVPLYTFNSPPIPFFGTLSLTITTVPLHLFPSQVSVTVTTAAGRSNGLPFRML